MLKKTLIVLLVVLIVMQFFHPSKNVSASPQPNALSKKYPIPPVIDSILSTSCYDCHSNNTRYPWYFNIQPVAWFLSKHVKDGKRHFNFDEFLTYSQKKQDHKLEEFAEEVEHGDMPLASYTLVHRVAVLDPQQKTALINWSKQLRADLKKP